MFFRSKAPLRIGLAGGGTDVSPYCDRYGGAILNATINIFANVTLEPLNTGEVILQSVDRRQREVLKASLCLDTDNGGLVLLKGVYNRIVRDFSKKPLSCRVTTHVEAPLGSGLGTSSTLVVAIIGAFAEWLQLPLGEYDIAHLAYQVEREDLNMAGGRQDQYAATFGGFNFMEFYADDKVIVNPLRIKQDYIHELEYNFLLYYTETSRLSSTIIETQQKNIQKSESKSIEATHKVKEQAFLMKEALLRGRLREIGKILDFGWHHKKAMAKNISNSFIDEIYTSAIEAGADGGKISGAGGGGFMTFFCHGITRYQVIDALKMSGGRFQAFQFTSQGLETWSSQ
jgi:D-glycero-alpha-D-manno-heptose-7-phosphate kinase